MRWSVGHLGFQGMRLRRDSRYTGRPKSVIDANLIYGDLRPFPCPIECCDVGDATAQISTIIDEEDCPCLTFTEHMCYFKHCGLYYWNDETGTPMISTQDQFCTGQGCDYGVDCPTTPPTISSINSTSGSSSTANCDSHYFSYRYSYVVEIGGIEFEGHWSPPTPAVLADAVPNAVLGGIPSPGGCHTKVRIYRAASGFHSGESANADIQGGWFNVGTYPIGGPYTDDRNYSTIQRSSPISPDEFNSPPSNLRSLGCTDNGVFFGLKDNTLMFTIPCYPMSWSDTRRICIPEKAGNAIKAVSYGDDIYVLTDKYPVLLKSVIGQESIGFDMTILPKIAPLVSQGSITKGYSGIFYASSDGYYAWRDTQLKNMTNRYLSKEEWCRSNEESINGTLVEDKLIWSTDVDAFMLYFGDSVSQISGLDPGEESAFLIGLDLNGLMPGATGHMLGCDNIMRFAKDGKVYKWDFCRDIVAEHHKNDIIIHDECCPWTYCDYMDADRCENLSRGEVKFDTRTLKNGVTLDLYVVKCGERELLTSLIIESCKPFTIPACHNTEEYCFEAKGCEHVKDFSFACSLKGLIDEPLPRGKVSFK